MLGLKKKYFKILNEIDTIKKLISNKEDYIIENRAALQLQTLLGELPYLPFTKSSLNYSSLVTLLNDIIVNNRRVILEFGSGLSTILILKLFEKNKIKGAKLISIENDEKWIDVLKSLIESNEFSEHIDIVHAPLLPNKQAIKSNLWYDEKAINESIRGLKIDTVIVDGPAAWYQEVALSRYPALPFIYDFLNESFSVFLDDTNRKGEKEILRMWNTKYQLEQIDFNKSFTGLFSNRKYDIRF